MFLNSTSIVNDIWLRCIMKFTSSSQQSKNVDVHENFEDVSSQAVQSQKDAHVVQSQDIDHEQQNVAPKE